MSLIGNMASARPVLTFGNVPEVRPLPSPGVTRLPQYYGPVRLPAQPETSLTGFQLVIEAPLDRVSRVALVSSCGVPSSLPRQDHRTEDQGSFPPSAMAAAFPFVMEGRLLRSAFSGPAQRSLALRPARSLNRLHDPFPLEASTWKLPAKPLELLPARMTKLPGGLRTH